MLIQIVNNLVYTLLNTILAGVQNYLSIFWLLVRRVDTGEIFDFALSCHFVQTFSITLFTNLEWSFNEDFYEPYASLFVRFSYTLAILTGEKKRSNLILTFY